MLAIAPAPPLPRSTLSDRDAQRYAAGRITAPGAPRIERDRIWMETHVELAVPPAAVISALLGGWRLWWRHGVVEPATLPHDLPAVHLDDIPFTPALTFAFKPVGYLISVQVTLSHPTHSRPSGVDTYRMPVDLRGHFVGPGEMIVTSRPSGGSRLISRWTGMRNATFLPTRLAAAMHFKAENGTSPLQHHTGYIGLISYLERESPAKL